MKRLLFLSALLFVLQTCKKSGFSDTEIKYFDIWKSVLQERNGFDNEYFHKHIRFKKIGIWQPNDGTTNQYCRVDYSFVVDYFEVKLIDQFMVWKSSADPLFPDYVVPKDQWLKKESVAYLIETNSNYSQMNWIVPAEKLYYKSKSDAKKVVDGNVKHTKFNGFELKGRNNIPLNQRGHLFINFFNEISSKDNNCLEVEVDLITGSFESRRTACWYD